MAMTIEMVRDMCFSLAAEQGFDLGNCKVSINGRFGRTLGRCTYGTFGVIKKLEFARFLIEGATDEEIIDVIKHEVAHALAFLATDVYHGHDAVFRAWCAKLGTTNDGTHIDHELKMTKPRDEFFKYTITCKECGEKMYRKRACSLTKELENYLCGCGGELKVVQNW